MKADSRDQLLRSLKQTLDGAKQAIDGAYAIAVLLLTEGSDRTALAAPDRTAAPGPGPQRLMTVKEAAELLQVSERSIYAWAREGKIPARRVGGKIRFHLDDLLASTEKEKETPRLAARSGMRLTG